MTMITYGYTILYVADVEETLAFYVRAFGLKQKFIGPDKDYGELDTGTTTLAFAAHSMATYNGFEIVRSSAASTPPPAEVAFVTDDIAGAYQKAVEASAVVVKEPTVKPWGQTVAYVRDPNGFLVEICTAVQS